MTNNFCVECNMEEADWKVRAACAIPNCAHLQKFPHIKWTGIVQATLEMSHDNGGIHRYRAEEEVIDALGEVLGAEGVYDDDLDKIDAWLNTLTKDELLIVVAGEEREMEALVSKSPDPEKTQGLLNDIFEHAC